MANADRAEWDCTMLFYAILFSDSFYGLSPLIRTNVDDLRKFRCEYFAHMTEGQLSNLDFSITVAKVETAFRALGLSTVHIQNVSKARSFPTDELQNVKRSNQKLTHHLEAIKTELQERHTEIPEKKAELQENKVRSKNIEEQHKVFD